MKKKATILYCFYLRLGILAVVMMSCRRHPSDEQNPGERRMVLDSLKAFDSAITKQLAELYINEKILGSASMDDAYHIAIATVNRIDVLFSWNFQHIVNWDKIRLFNSINMKLC